jgi:NAD+ kinase
VTQVGVSVHPSRDIHEPLGELRRWVERHGASLVQVGGGAQQEVAPVGGADDCEVVVSIGGDGTALAAIRAAAPSGVPVLGVAFGSLGALTTVPADGLTAALDHFEAGDWHPIARPALAVTRGDEVLLAYNDLAVVRRGEGQVRTHVELDGELYARLAGDGMIVATPIGSGAYTMAAGGPLLAPGANAFVFTPLPTHGGSIPPLVVSGDSTLRLTVSAGFGGARLEIDGRVVDEHDGPIEATLRPGAAALVGLGVSVPFLTGLRERGVISDSPRVLAEEAARHRT